MIYIQSLTAATIRRFPVFGILFISLCLSGCGRIWIQPPRSEENIDALKRVEIKTYVFEEAGGVNMEYGLYVPTSYEMNASTPLVIALHGNGSGPMYMMEYNNLLEFAENYGYIVATPIGYSETGWFGSTPPPGFKVTAPDKELDTSTILRLSEMDVLNVLDEVTDQYNVDSDRVYLIGQSMGGSGVWYLGTKYPNLWAAIAPLSPVTGEDPSILENAPSMPVIVVAGDRDIEVDIEVTRRWVAKMEELGMNYDYLEIAGGSHSGSGRENIGEVFDFLSKHQKP